MRKPAYVEARKHAVYAPLAAQVKRYASEIVG